MDLLLRQFHIGLRLLAVMLVTLGLCYPAAMWALGRIDATAADGGFVTEGAHGVIGSALIGQSFDEPQWFHGRPSAAGSGYDAMASGGSNLGPTSAVLLHAIAARVAAAAMADGVPKQVVPADAVTASASGLDPDISPANAEEQVARVASARGLARDRVARLVKALTQGRTLGLFGEPRVNVLALNEALANLR